MMDGGGIGGGQPEAGGRFLDDRTRAWKVLVVVAVFRIKFDLAAQPEKRFTGLTPLRHLGDLRVSEALVVLGNLFGELAARALVVVRLEGLLFGQMLGWVNEFVAILRHLGTGRTGSLGAGDAQVVVFLDGSTLRIVRIHPEAVTIFRHGHELALDLNAAHLGNGVCLLGELLDKLASILGRLRLLALLLPVDGLGSHLQVAPLLLLGGHIAAELVRSQLITWLISRRYFRFVKEYLPGQYFGAGIHERSIYKRGVLHAIGVSLSVGITTELQVLRVTDRQGAGAVDWKSI